MKLVDFDSYLFLPVQPGLTMLVCNKNSVTFTLQQFQKQICLAFLIRLCESLIRYVIFPVFYPLHLTLSPVFNTMELKQN